MPHADPKKRQAYMRKWRAQNRSKMRDYNKIYQATHRERINKLHREWKSKHQTKVCEWSRLDYQKHKKNRRAKHAEYGRTHRAQINEQISKWRKTSEAHKTWLKQTKKRRAQYAKQYRRITNPKYKHYIDRNREKIAEAARKWRATSPVYNRWRKRNKKTIRANALRRYHRCRDCFREYQRLYNVSRPPRRAAVFIKWKLCNRICYICGKRLLLKDVWMDHVIPVTKGGTNEIGNLMPTHRDCNVRKGNKLNYPVMRPDLVLLVSTVQSVPRRMVT